MIEAGRIYHSTRSGGTLVLVHHWEDTNGEFFEVERSMPPGTGKAVAHRHLDADQVFTVVEGQMRTIVGGEERALGPGEAVTMNRGEPHVDPWNPGPSPALVRTRIAPAAPMLKAYADMMFACAERGDLNDQDELPGWRVLALMHATHGQSFSAGVPMPVQKLTVSLAGPILALRARRRDRTPATAQP